MAINKEALLSEMNDLVGRLNAYRKNAHLRDEMDAKVREETGFESLTTEQYCLLRIQGITQIINRDGHELDNCQICKGHQGGEKGNENIVDGIVMCDYCSCAADRFKLFYDMTPKKGSR